MDTTENRRNHVASISQPSHAVRACVCVCVRVSTPVFSEHEYAQRLEVVEARDLLDTVVIEIEEDEAPQVVQVLDPTDGVVLVVKESQLVLPLQHRTHVQTASVEIRRNEEVGVETGRGGSWVGLGMGELRALLGSSSFGTGHTRLWSRGTDEGGEGEVGSVSD